VRNESTTLAQVIQNLQLQQITQIRVVDNGSQYNSAAIAIQEGAEVVFEPIPGYGQACSTGLENLPPAVEWILFCDGDGSDDLTQLPLLLQETPEFDLILGNRRATAKGRQALTPVQNFGNRLATLLISLGWGYSYQDLGPLRLIRRTALEKLQLEDRGFGWTVEMQVKGVEQKLKIKELSVNYRPRQGGKSKISGTLRGSIQAGTIILSTLGNLYLNKQQNLLTYLSPLLLMLGASLMIPGGDFADPQTTIWFWWGTVTMSLGFILSWGLSSLSHITFWLVTLSTRLLLLPMAPGDDIWRYLWEGYIQNLGYSPYYFPPDAPILIPYRLDWWEYINHPSVSAIYPPLTQWGFRLLAAINPEVLLFKISFILADLITCFIIQKSYKNKLATIYAWNPLVIYSFAGGGHYDSWFILPLVGAWLSWQSHRSNFLTGLLLGVSAGVKWVSLPLVSFFLKERPQQALPLLLGVSLPLILTAIPFCQRGECPLIPTSSSFVSYGRSAELFPYLLGIIWSYSLTVNWIYGIPLVITLVILLWRAQNFRQFSLGYFLALYIFSPIIHSWYFTWSIPFAVPKANLVIKGLSISAFIYFFLPYRQGLGIEGWYLYPMERWWLWFPLVVVLFQLVFRLVWFNWNRRV